MNKPLQNFSLLIVDDEPELREMLREEFESAGAKVGDSASGNEAIERIKREHFDLVISDFHMPNGNGMDLLRAIRAEDSKLPYFIFITGQFDFVQAQAFAAGASAIFPKPTNIEDVISTIQNLLMATS